jgi:hypothetical protein
LLCDWISSGETEEFPPLVIQWVCSSIPGMILFIQWWVDLREGEWGSPVCGAAGARPDDPWTKSTLSCSRHRIMGVEGLLENLVRSDVGKRWCRVYPIHLHH